MTELLVGLLPGLQATITETVKSASIYLFWTAAHEVSAYLYHEYCTVKTWQDAIIAPWKITAPHCRGLLQSMKTTTDVFGTLWITTGTWIVARVPQLYAAKGGGLAEACP